MSVQLGTKPKETKRNEGGFAETVRVVIHALIIALVIRTFLFQPFNIPSGSMIPTLLVGDYLFVSKYSYGYTPLFVSIFAAVLFRADSWAAGADRGDVVVFRLPKDDSTDYIKRVIGLPGDHIQMIDGVLNINGEPVKRQRIDDFVSDDDGAVQRVKRFRETLPNGVTYTTLDLTDNGFYDNTQVYTVPPGDYFMMGDNRDNSTDSRVLSAVGYVPSRTSSVRRRSSSFRSGTGPRLGVLALAVDGTLEPAVDPGPMSRRSNDKPVAALQALRH